MWKTLKTLDLPESLHYIFLTGDGEIEELERYKVFDLNDALASIKEIKLEINTQANDPAYLVYTSGTTGYPKGVLHAHRAIIGRQPASKYWFDFEGDDDRIVHSGKFNWTYVLGSGLNGSIFI
jgi:acetyl-CoA synthetase